MRLMTDEKFMLAEEDYMILHTQDLAKTSGLWKIKNGSSVEVFDNATNRIFTGDVVGFNKKGQSGRDMYIMTNKGTMIWMDAFTTEADILTVRR